MTPTLVCERCPTDGTIWYGSDPVAFAEHLAAAHCIVLCDKCGVECDGKIGGYCRDCFIAKWG